jgi:biopolymer transport protein ExbD
MIDIIFLLLTFFILTARFRVPEQFLPISLTSAAQARQIGVIEPLVINLSAHDSQCIIDFGAAELAISDDTIDADLAAFVGDFVEVLRLQKRHVGDPVEIVCSDDVKWDYLVKIYNVLYAMGINDITFAMTE